MPPSINKLTFDGPMNERGFWLYVWKIHHPEKGDLLYVGRTGDSSSPNAASPIKRMGQHLDPKSKGNMLHRKLKKRCIEPVSCPNFELVSYGPLFAEVEFDGDEPKLDFAQNLDTWPNRRTSCCGWPTELFNCRG